MTLSYNWIIEEVNAKKSFRDKNNILRENVINSVRLAYVGKRTDENNNSIEKKEVIISSLNLIDLSDFRPLNEFSKEELLDIALSCLHPNLKKSVERRVKSLFNDIQEESNSITIILNDD